MTNSDPADNNNEIAVGVLIDSTHLCICGMLRPGAAKTFILPAKVTGAPAAILGTTYAVGYPKAQFACVSASTPTVEFAVFETGNPNA